MDALPVQSKISSLTQMAFHHSMRRPILWVISILMYVNMILSIDIFTYIIYIILHTCILYAYNFTYI